jgi:signal transduction histidine kinase
MRFEFQVQRYDEGVYPPLASHKLTIRTALLLGLGVTLMLWLFSGYYFTRRVSELQRDAARVTDRYVKAQARMSAVRSQTLLASVYVRDALLDPNPESIVDYRMKLEETFRIGRRALDQYEPVLAAESESTRVADLRRQLSAFEETVFDVLGGDSTRWPVDALPLLRDRIMPKREEAVQMSEDVQTLNRTAYIDQQSAMASIYRTTQQRIWTQFGLAIAASFAIGLLVFRYVDRLERELRRQQERDAQSSAELQRLSGELITAQEAERRSIARELHDEVGQALTAIKMELAVAARSAGPPEHTGQALLAARTLTEGALQTVRDMSKLLHPSTLDDIGMSAAIETYIREFQKRYDMPVEFVQTGMERRLPPETESAIYRVVQEALTNVARHASARSCKVSLRHSGAEVQVEVADDGVGFAAQALQEDRRGIGLIGMRERILKLKGRCVIDTAPGCGTRVVVTIDIGGGPDVATHVGPGAVLGLATYG